MKQFLQNFKIDRFKVQLSHLSFCLIYSVISYIIYNAFTINKIVKWFYIKGEYDYLGLGAYYLVGLSLSIAVFVLVAHRWTIKPFAIFFTIMSGMATYFIVKYDVAIDLSMLENALNTDPTEVRGLLSIQMIPYILFLIILPIIGIYLVDIQFQSKARYLIRSVSVFVGSIILALVLLYAQFNPIHRAGNMSRKYIVYQLTPVNHMQSMIGMIQYKIQGLLPDDADKSIRLTANITKPDEDLIVVLVVGESARQKNFNLYGYTRKNTNPMLSKVKDLHALNGVAKYGSTLYALPEILKKQDVSIATVSAAAGIQTACYSHFSLYDNCGTVDQIRVSNCKYGDDCYDEDVLPLLKNNLQTYMDGYRFIVLHLGGGSHGPNYQKRIPEYYYRFLPLCDDADVINECTENELYNSYDNTILYTDYVLANIIKELDDSGAPYVFIYVSDHGESLMEEDRVFHGMPPGVPLPPEQKHVPLIVKSSIPITILDSDEYSQPDVFDSVLDLLSIETNISDKGGSFLKK